MPRIRIEGSFVALITPFDESGRPDFGAFRALLELQREHGTSAVLIMGSTGEVSMLSQSEREEIVTRTAAMKTGEMRLFFGCTGNNTRSTIENVRSSRLSTPSSRPKVKRCAAPDWLPSGATTHTSSLSVSAISRITAMPGASTPSSLVIRIRFIGKQQV